MVLFILGRSAQPAMQKKVHFYTIYVRSSPSTSDGCCVLQSPMTKLFRKVFPYLLQLGCDVEKVHTYIHNIA